DLADRIWQERDSLLLVEGERAALVEELRGHAAAVEDLCEAQGGLPAGLPIRSRRVYAWMRFLTDPAVLLRHLEALRRAAESAAALRPGEAERLTLRLVNIGALWRGKRSAKRALITVSEGFLAAPAEIWEALVRPALLDTRRSDRRIAREFADSEEFAEVILEMEAHVRPPGSARGRHHDLEASFARVNAEYFSGDMAKPALVWNEVPTLEKFGHYHRSRDTVMLSVSLDEPHVPEFVVDQVLHHELLHKKHGVRRVLGRGVAHTRAFREEERRFRRYREAQEFLQALATRLRRRAAYI
ncbi:MAG: M48 family peptidase, partial [Planctomycetota bacterium]